MRRNTPQIGVAKDIPVAVRHQILQDNRGHYELCADGAPWVQFLRQGARQEMCRMGNPAMRWWRSMDKCSNVATALTSSWARSPAMMSRWRPERERIGTLHAGADLSGFARNWRLTPQPPLQLRGYAATWRGGAGKTSTLFSPSPRSIAKQCGVGEGVRG